MRGGRRIAAVLRCRPVDERPVAYHARVTFTSCCWCELRRCVQHSQKGVVGVFGGSEASGLELFRVTIEASVASRLGLSKILEIFQKGARPVLL